jgi:Lon protease-like protein
VARAGELIEGLPMFPLGNPLLPGARIPLHVFEPRYRALVEHCLAGTREFGVVLIERGSEVGGGDARFDVGTIARIEAVQRFEDGRYALLALGADRIRIEAWRADAPYPSAVVRVLAEPVPGPAAAVSRRDLADTWDRVCGLASALGVGIDAEPLPADPLDAVWFAAARAITGPLDAHRVLAADDLDVRFATLLDALAGTELMLRHRLDPDR